MRRCMLIANAATAVFFVAFLVYTYLARPQLDQLAREFVTVKTQEIAAPLVDFTDKALNSKIVRELLSTEQISAIETEIAEYRDDPPKYISQLTGQRVPAATRNFDNPMLTKINQWKGKVREHYHKVLAGLFWDLRIFAGSNAIAACVALWFAYHAKSATSKKYMWLSFMLFASLAYCVYMYIDSFSFFTILFNSYIGWWYPAILMLTFTGSYFWRTYRLKLVPRN